MFLITTDKDLIVSIQEHNSDGNPGLFRVRISLLEDR